MTRDRWVVIRAHNGTNRACSFRIAGFSSDSFVRQGLPFRDFPNDRANFFGECFHILSVPECVGLAIFCPPLRMPLLYGNGTDDLLPTTCPSTVQLSVLGSSNSQICLTRARL